MCGLSDPTAHVSVNFLGAPALTMRQYPAYKQNILVGAGFRVTAPLGQYDPTRLINIGTNRWSFKPELGVSKGLGRLTVEFLGAAAFFTPNNDFLRREHAVAGAPLLGATQRHLHLQVGHLGRRRRALLYGGGATTVNGGEPSEPQENSRVGAVLVFPAGKKNSFKAYWSSGVSTRTGTDFDTFVVSWVHLWGGKR